MKKSKPCFIFYKIILSTLLFICMAVFLFPLQTYAQAQTETGLPFITNYSPKSYNAYPQTWCVQEDESGIMYFGSQGYILEYDGVKWNKIPLVKDVIRSIAKHKDGLIYYGGFGNLGYLDNDSIGQKKPYTLLNLVPAENRDFLDIWSTYSTELGIYFQSREYIFRLDNSKPGANEKKTMKVWKPKTKFMYAFYLDGNYYVHQQGLGLFKMVNDSLELIPGSEFLGKERMQVMLPYKTETNEKQYLIGLFYSGLYLFNGKTFQPFATKADPVIKSGSILYKGLQLKNGTYVLSTTGKGLVIIDAQGNLLQKINRDVGLQDESIYGTYEDKKGTLWLALDNGISRVETASPLTKFSLQSGINTGVLNITRFNGDLYIGTTNGLLAFNNKTSFFDQVPGIPQNQVFTLLADGKQLLVPGDGLFALKDKKISTIRASVSADLTLSALYIPNKHPNILLGGGTFGVVVFDRNGATAPVNGSVPWHFAGYVPGITDQIWTITENKDGTIWAGTQNGPVYHIDLSFGEKGNVDVQKTKFEKYGSENGIKDGTGQVYNIKGINYFYSENSLYTFNDTVKRFIPDSTFGKFDHGGGNAEYDMTEDRQGRVWIRFGKETRLAIPKPGGGYLIDKSQLNTISELTIQKIYPESNGIVWVCTTDGLIRYDENLEKNYDQSFKTVIRHVSAGKNLLNTGIGVNIKPVAISYKNNTLRFEYAAPFFEQEEKTTYQTWLEGFEKGWSDFDNNYYKEYTNLPAGDYHFHVRAKNVYQKISVDAVYNFSIHPPWYLAWWAYLLYAVAAILLIYALIRWRTYQLHEKHRELEKTVSERTSQLSERVEELAVINSVQEGLVSEMDMQGIYDLVGEKIREIFHAQVIDIVTYDKTTNLLEDRYSYEKGERTLVGKWKPAGFRKHVIDTGQLLLINEDSYNKSIEFNSPVISGEPPKSAVWVPLISGNEVKGMISLQDLDKEHAFSDSDVNLLTTLANSMSVALESARRFDETNRLLKETKQRNAELAVINSVQESLVAQMDMKSIYELVGEKIRNIFQAQVIDIVTYDPRTNLIEDQYAYEKGDRTLLGARVPKGIRKHIIQTGEVLLHNENVEQASRDLGNEVLIGEMPKSQVYVPMIAGGEVKGVISLQNLDREHAFSDSDVSLITTLANSMSVALESARLFDETTRLLKETEQRNAELAVINSVQESLVAKMDIKGIYELVGEKIREIFDAQVIDIVTYDTNKNLIEDQYSYEKGDRTLVGPRAPKGFRKHVIQTSQLLLHNTGVEQATRDFDNAVLIGEMPKSQVFVPMIASGKVKGIISLQNLDREQAFSNSDISLLTTLANSMSVALESARLFDETTRLLKETEQRAAELAIINTVQQGLASKLDMQAIYDLVGDKVTDIFKTEVVYIAIRRQDDINVIEFPYYLDRGNRIGQSGVALGEGITSKVILSRKPLLANTMQEQLDEGGIYDEGEESESYLGVPIVLGEFVAGVVSVQSYKQHAFSESDERLLTTLASSMSVALESARLFDETTRLLKETEQRTAELSVINSVQQGLAKELDIQGIYELVGEKMREIFNAQVIDIVTYDPKLNIIEDRYAYEKGDTTLLGPREPKGIRKHIIDNGQLLVINHDYEKLSQQYNIEILYGEQPKSVVVAPMVSGGKVNGMISLQNLDHEYAFSDSDISLLTTLSSSMSVALESARLFDETNRLLKETEQRTAELSVINSVQDGLAKELDIQGIYNLVGEKIREIFNAQVIDIVTYDPKTNLIEDRYSFEKGDTTLLGPREPKGFRKNIIETGRLLVINHDYDKMSLEYGNQILIGEQPKSAVLVPMISGGKVNGMVSLQNLDHEYAFSDSDVNLLNTLSNSMSVALESARLFDETNRLLKETEQRTAELAVINSVQEGLAKELDMQGIYDLIGDRVQKLFDAQSVIIATLDLENKIEHFNYAFEDGKIFHHESRPFNKVRKLLIEKKHSIYIPTEEIAKNDYGLSALAGTKMSKSLLFVPLLTGNIIRGYVSLQNIDTENAFSESNIRLLETLANSMSVALENARLFDETNRLLKETEQRTAELSVINSVQDGLAKELDMQGIYELVGEKMREIFNAQVFDIVTYDKTTKLIEDRYTYEKGDRSLLPPRPLIGFRKHVVETCQPLVINTEMERHMKELGNIVLAGEASKSVVFVPMIAGGEATGVISLQNVDQENAFSNADVRLLTTLGNSMTVALESARLFDETNRLLKETERRTAELSVINSVQEGLAKEQNIQGIYDLVGEKMREIFNAQVIDIVNYDKRTRLIEDRYTYEKGDRTLLGPRPLKGFRKHVIEKAKILAISKDVDKLRSTYDNTVIVGEAAKSLVFVPMITGGEVTGVTSLQNLDKENAFSDADINLLTTLVNSMSVALESARLFDETTRLLDETEQRTAELAVINSVQEGLAKELDIQGIYNFVGDRICELFDTQSVFIRSFDHATGFEHWQYVVEKGQRISSEDRPMIWANRLLVKTKQYLLINKNYAETAKKHGGTGVSKGFPPKSAIFIPMISGDVVKGSVSLQNIDRENAFTESDIRLLTTLTNSMSVALENARLFNETTHLLAEAKQSTTELSTVNSISKALASQLDADDLIKLVGDQLKDLFNANIVYMALLNTKTNIIHFPYQYGDDNTPMKLGEGLTSKIILTGEPLLINKNVEELTAQFGIQQMGVPSSSYLGVPIPVGDKIIGVLSIQSTEQENRFNENDLRLLSTIASSVGVALNNATLFEDVQLARMEAEAAGKQAEKANEAKSAFLSTVSHELRTPLTSVLGFAKIIKKRLEERIFPLVDRTDAKTEKAVNQVSENLEVVISEGTRLTHLINDVLDLAKIEAGKMEFAQENVSMFDVAERALAATTSLFEQKSLKLIRKIDTDLPEIIGDKDKLIQVMINLISNSVKFTDEGSITCSVHQENGEIIASIRDTGIGIAPEDYGAVFEQFKQVGGDTLTDKPKGTGLGLPICKEIVEHLGGRIWVESERGVGSIFSFALPLKNTHPIVKERPIHLDDLVKQLKQQVAHSQLNLLGQASNILIVDDDDSIRSLLQQELGDAGYFIDEARNGKEALEKVKSHRPDLIILDIMMPEMNGFDVAAILKNDPQTMEIPIIVLSVIQDKARGFRIGVDRYLTKPIDTNLLFSEIGSLLEHGKSKKKVMIVDEDAGAVKTLTEVLTTKGYELMESTEHELVENAKLNQPDIIIINSALSGKQDIVQTLRFEKGLENVVFLVYQ